MNCKYEYLLVTWGGFWNLSNLDIHGEPNIPQWFDTREARDQELRRLFSIANHIGDILLSQGGFNDSVIAYRESEGYLTRYEFIIQSHVKVGEEILVIENNLGLGFFSTEELDPLGHCADYMKEWKYAISADLPEDAERLFTTLLLRKPEP